MQISPDLRTAGSVSGGTLEFSLKKSLLLNDYRSGKILKSDICDAHPELLRAAKNVGRITEDACPICESGILIHVFFAFGKRLPSGGRCITSTHELEQIVSKDSSISCYVVEVCAECGWNYLLSLLMMGNNKI